MPDRKDDVAALAAFAGNGSASSRSTQNGTAPALALSVVSARDYRAIKREPLEPMVAAPDGATVALARGTSLGIAGPSGVGKSLAALDLAGRLADDGASSWLGLRVTGGQRVVYVPLEGSDDDLADRVGALVPDAALDRLAVIDPHRGARPDAAAVTQIAAAVREHEADVLVIDTLSAFLAGQADTSAGVREDAWTLVERIEREAGRPLAKIVVLHTRKADRSAGTITDELEELSGDVAKKLDAALTIRRDGPEGPRRRARLIKTRRGPEPRAVIATFPADASEPPRLTVITRAAPVYAVKEGAEAERIAEWVRKHDRPQPVTAICAALNIGQTTLRRRRAELEVLGVERHPVPGGGNTQAYGTAEQWKDAYGRGLAPAEQPAEQPAAQPAAPNPPRNPGGLESPGETGESQGIQPAAPQPAATLSAGWESPASTEDSQPAATRLSLEGESAAPAGAPTPSAADNDGTASGPNPDLHPEHPDADDELRRLAAKGLAPDDDAEPTDPDPADLDDPEGVA